MYNKSPISFCKWNYTFLCRLSFRSILIRLDFDVLFLSIVGPGTLITDHILYLVNRFALDASLPKSDSGQDQRMPRPGGLLGVLEPVARRIHVARRNTVAYESHGLSARLNLSASRFSICHFQVPIGNEHDGTPLAVSDVNE